MITIPALDGICPDLNKYERMARILAKELPSLHLLSEPLDVVDSLENLSDEMTRMPQVIVDCRLATEAFNELDQVIDRMFALADCAVELSEDNRDQRKQLDEEFKIYSQIVSRLAGADNYGGPSLNLSSRDEAVTARKVLSFINEARRGFTRKLDHQRRQINQAMDEVLNLLMRLVSDVEELSYYNREQLSEILDHLGAMEELNTDRYKERRPSRLLH